MGKETTNGIINRKFRDLRKQLLLLLIIVLFSGCYTVSDRKFLGIVFNDSKLDGSYLEKYVDSVRNKGTTVPDSISEIFFNGDTISNSERIIYFKSDPKEWYLIDFQAAPCVMESVYNPNLSNGPIYDSIFINKKQQIRIRNRFINEVLKPAEQYGKVNHIPDSLIYTKFKIDSSLEK